MFFEIARHFDKIQVNASPKKAFLTTMPSAPLDSGDGVEPGDALVKRLKQAQREYKEFRDYGDMLLRPINSPICECNEGMLEMVRVFYMDPGLAMAVYRMFYNLVESNYWHQMEAGNTAARSLRVRVRMTLFIMLS